MSKRDEIIGIINSITKSQTRMGVEISGETFTTKIIRLNLNADQFIADQLLPKDGNLLLERDAVYTFKNEHYEAGVVNITQFQAAYVDKVELRDMPALIFTFPPDFTQRSILYDVEPRKSDEAVIHISKRPLEIRENIIKINSHYLQFKSGVQVSLPPNGMHFTGVEIKIPTGEIIVNVLLTRKAKYLYQAKYSEISAEAFALLNQYITERYHEDYAPLHLAPRKPDKVLPSVIVKPRTEFPRYKGKIFIVDDEKQITELFAKILGRNNYLCYEFNNGSGLLENARRIMPDVILLDIKMPDYDGLTLCRRLKRDPVCHQIPVLIVSGGSAEEDVIEAKEAGAAGYIVKSADLTIKDLIVRIESVLPVKKP